jgi:hypothetical protein
MKSFKQKYLSLWYTPTRIWDHIAGLLWRGKIDTLLLSSTKPLPEEEIAGLKEAVRSYFGDTLPVFYFVYESLTEELKRQVDCGQVDIKTDDLLVFICRSESLFFSPKTALFVLKKNTSLNA